MLLSQDDVEEILKMKARRRVPRIQAALAKTLKNLSTKEAFVAEAIARAEKKVAAWESLKVQYEDHLVIIEGGSYPGYNGKPFGATPGILKGVTF